jgi:hypothetical protein
MKTNFECSLYLELLTRVCAAGVGGGTLGRAPSDESLDYLASLTSRNVTGGAGHWTYLRAAIQGPWMGP